MDQFLNRKFLIAGNWKMFKTPAETKKFIEDFLPLCPKELQSHFLIFPPTLCLHAFREATAGTMIQFGAQNAHSEFEGAFTGENSPRTLKEFGCRYVLLGHSERRQLFAETDAVLAKKVQSAIQLGLTPMLCVGETLSQRQAGQTLSVLKQQLTQGLSLLQPGQTDLVVAYEPVWAIGTGQVATPEQAEEAHVFIRETLKSLLQTDQTLILYGGSVKPDNAASLAEKPNIDGFLIGGASLKTTDFWSIGDAARRCGRI